jgi:hypothetical protein
MTQRIRGLWFYRSESTPGYVKGEGARVTDLEKIQRCKVTIERSNLHVMRLPLPLSGLEKARVRLFPGGEFELQLLNPGFTVLVVLLDVGRGEV